MLPIVKPNVTKRDPAKEVEVIAARWVARVEGGRLSSEDAAELDAWLSADSRHTGAYARARAIGHFSDRAAALGATYNPRTFGRQGGNLLPKLPSLSRRQLLWGGSAMVAGLGAVLMVAPDMPAFGRTYVSDLGQMRVVSLADGSVVNLNTSSRIRVHFTRHRRDVWLEQGEVLFDVAKDVTRPFIVRAGAVDIQALGTSFVVQKLADKPIQVLVREGTVQVEHGSTVPAVKISANMRALSPEAGHELKATPIAVSYVPPHDIERTTAWLDGRIAFEGETLREAASEFSRYSDVNIVIEDPAIANEKITGLYQTVNPIGFARSVAVIFDLKTDISEKQIRLYRQKFQTKNTEN
jgi:transmembrane sensor